ncbi:MAG TPA: hypothetical protein VK815_07965 [Candidatus Acidoferrales bacterium]|jgi:hypothetical protein|nr:hypothetical protein [Candidatus Acidoferrales bacterium]
MTSIASTRATFATACLGAAFLSLLTVRVSAQTNYYNPNGTEYSVAGSQLGDQMYPAVALSATGGFLVWQDNITDGDGWGISARRLNSTLSGTLSTFRVNQAGAGDQEHPCVAMLKNGGAVFAWQGGLAGSQHIYSCFVTASNLFVTTNDVLVNTYTNNFQVNPAVATLANSNVVVVWGSFDQVSSNSYQDVYGQILSPTGQKIGGEFLVNEFTSFNQRTPAVAATANGGFVVAWVSEQERIIPPSLGTNDVNGGVTYSANQIVTPSVDIYARQFTSTGTPVTDEFRVNTANNVTANPSVAAATDGTFMVAWGEKDGQVQANGWDIYARSFDTNGTGGASIRVNTHLDGDQYTPHVSSLGVDYLVIWTSLGQDGSFQGVYGQFMRTGGTLTGGEFRANTTTVGRQMQPAVASDGGTQFLVTWTSFTGDPYSFDLFAQRYANAAAVLQDMPQPYVYAPFVVSNNVYQPRLVVTWAPLLGIPVANYEVFVDGSSSPTALVTNNQWTMTAANGLTVNSTHSFQVDYVTTDGRRPQHLSPAASGTTWQGYSWGGIPFEWMTEYYGSDISQWPSANSKLGGTTMTVMQVFTSGGNPMDPSTWLKQQLTKTAQGMFLNWCTQPGATYQVQVTSDFTTWSNVGPARFAAGTADSMYVGGSPTAYYRVALLR